MAGAGDGYATVIDLTKQLEDLRARLTTSADTWAAAHPELLPYVLPALHQLIALLGQPIGELKMFLEGTKSPEDLRNAATAWTSAVLPLRNEALVNSMAPAQLSGLASWTGQGGKAYGRTATAQSKSFGAVATIGDHVSSTLNTIAGALQSFWVAIALALGGVVIALVGLVAVLASGGLSVVALIAGVVTAVYGFIQAFANAKPYLHRAMVSAAESMKSLPPAFPGDTWPPALAGVGGESMRDATTRDGDASAWTPYSVQQRADSGH